MRIDLHAHQSMIQVDLSENPVYGRHLAEKKATIKYFNIFPDIKRKVSPPITYAGDFGGLADTRGCETFSYFPGENRRIVPFALDDCGDDTGGEKPGSAPSDGLGLQESCATVAAQDLTDATVGHLKEFPFFQLNAPVERLPRPFFPANI